MRLRICSSGSVAPNSPRSRVPSDQVGDRAADADHVRRVVEHLQVTAVPGDKPSLAVGHRDALRHVLHRRLQQLAAEAQFLRGFVEQFRDFLGGETASAQRVREHEAGGRCTDRAGEHSLHVLHEAAIGRVRVPRQRPQGLQEILAQRGFRRRVADDAFRNRQHVADSCARRGWRCGRGQGRTHELGSCHAVTQRGAPQQRQPDQHQDIAAQREQGAAGHRAHVGEQGPFVEEPKAAHTRRGWPRPTGHRG